MQRFVIWIMEFFSSAYGAIALGPLGSGWQSRTWP